MDVTNRANEITGANAGGARQLTMWTRWAARIAQFWRFGNMSYLTKVALAVASLALSGCMSDREAKDMAETLAAPFNSLSNQLSGAYDLTYATGAFWRKNQRWPKDYEELSGFVQSSGGLLALGRYERVDFFPQPEGGLEIFSVAQGRTIRTTIPPPPKSEPQ